MATDLRDKIQQRRLDRMRLGQSAYEIEHLISDPEIRVALVPLIDVDAENALLAAARMDIPDNVAGMMARDHRQRVELLACSVRDPQDLEKKIYRDGTELQSELEEADIVHLYDRFLEMQENSNPSIDGIPAEEFDELKKAFQEMDWSGLSGRSWYAAKRFLGALHRDGLLPVNSHGSTSNTKLTTKSE